MRARTAAAGMLMLLAASWQGAQAGETASARVARHTPEQSQGTAGQSIYLNGALGSGGPLVGLRGGGSEQRGREAACVNCHQRSGLGSREGEIFIPPITGDYLFHPHEHSGDQPVLPYVASMRSNRSPYDDETLARAIRAGIDSNGRPLSYLMPRFALGDADMASLIAYLKALAVHRTPGVTDTLLHFATVFTPDADPVKRAGVLDVLQHYVAEKNSFPFGPSPRMWTSGKTGYSKSMYMANRRWQLHVWDLTGPPAEWPAQLDRHLQQEPVFALLSGLGGSHWEPVHAFCERQQLPCLFPNVEVPVIDGRDFYSLYFSRGVLLEAGLIADRVMQVDGGHAHRNVHQLFRAGDSGEAAARALAEALRGRDYTLHEHVLPAEGRGRGMEAALQGIGKDDAVVLWLRASDIAALKDPPQAGAVYVSGLMGGLEDTPLPASWRARTELSFPLDPPERRGVRLDYPLGWFSFRHIPVVAEPVQVDTYLACSLLTDVLHHDMSDNITRAYLVEQVQHMLERRLITGYYPHLSLASDQRFASKGGFLVHFTQPAGRALATDTEWIVP